MAPTLAELAAYATGIKRRATRRLGELIEERRKAGLLAKGGGDKRSDHRDSKNRGDPPSLAEQGVDNNLAAKARKLAAMPEELFPACCANCCSKGVPASAGIT